MEEKKANNISQSVSGSALQLVKQRNKNNIAESINSYTHWASSMCDQVEKKKSSYNSFVNVLLL